MPPVLRTSAPVVPKARRPPPHAHRASRRHRHTVKTLGRKPRTRGRSELCEVAGGQRIGETQ
eukprot:6956316-Pyramimonas_sp.AAC.1